MVLLRPALCSTAFGGGLSCGGPSIPLPLSVFSGAEHCPPGLGGALAGGEVSALFGFAVKPPLRRATAPP